MTDRSSVSVADMARLISRKVGCTEVIARAVLKAEYEVAVELLREDIAVPTLNGTLKVSAPMAPARTARNPATGETIDLASRKTVKARISAKLKDAVRDAEDK